MMFPWSLSLKPVYDTLQCIRFNLGKKKGLLNTLHAPLYLALKPLDPISSRSLVHIKQFH